MKVSASGLEFLKQKEGLRLVAYTLGDGRYTIGYGNTFYEDGSPVKAFDSITKERADRLFAAIVAKFESEVSSLILTKVTQAQFDALVSYAYNRGVSSLANSTLLSMVNANPNNPAIAQQFVTEWGSNSAYKNALIARRQQEADLYFSGSSIAGISGGWWAVLILLSIIILNQNTDDGEE
jgi:lysozyme